MTNIKSAALTACCLLSLAACSGGEEKSKSDTPSSSQTPNEAALGDDAMVPAATLDEAILRERIATLSSDDFAGRAPATEGGAKTRAFLIDEMKKIGLEPANGDSFEQPVPLVEVTLDPGQSSFSIGGARLEYGPETVFWTKRVVENVSFEDSDLVFVGYGVVAPEYGWNDYEGVDVEGKTVVMLVNDPGFATGNDELFNGRAMTYYGRWTYKYEEAARQGAAAAIVIHQTEPAAYGWGVVEGSWTGPQLDLERPDGGAGRVALEGWIHEDAAKAVFANAGMDFGEMLEAAKSADFKAQPMGDLKASGAITNTIRRSASANVAGVLRGAERPDEYVLYMAHWDHLGVNENAEGDGIANGAVDNATGTAGILSVAEAFASNEKRPERSVLFVGVTAEESGLLGSAYFAEDPIVPLKNIVGGINIDAILPTPPAKDLIVIGFGSSELEDVLQKAALKRGLYLRPDAQPENGYFYRSDHISLAKKGVPMLYSDSGIDLIEGGETAGTAFTDDYTKNRYHGPADEYTEDWDMRAMVQALEVFYETGAALAYSDDWPNWYDGNEFRAIRDEQRAGE